MKGFDVTVPFRQLVERRLWPLALLLLAGLAAVPLLLARDGGDAAPVASSQAAPAPAPASGTQPVVSVADAGTLEQRRKVLGAAKDPFRPAAGPPVEKTETSTPRVLKQLGGSVASSPSGSSGSPVTGTSGGAPAGPPTPPVTVSPVPTAPEQVFELYSLIVRFGDSTADKLPLANLKRLKAMPSVDDPAVIYLGLLRDLKTAVFLVDAGTVVQGDGRCLPTPDNCQTLQLRVGETAFFDVTDEDGSARAQYQLDLVKVVKRKTTDATAAERARLAEARGGRDALNARLSRVGRFRYDASTGTVKRVSRKAHRAAVARRAASTR